jgi:AFG3 family protein
MKENPNTKPKLIKRIPNIPKKPQKGSKFNIFWVYAAIILGLILLQFLFSADTTKDVTYRTFETQMLLPGDVEKLVAYKHEDLVKVEVYIKKDRLNTEKYKKYISKNNFGTANGPAVYFTSGSMDALDTQLRESQKNLPPDQQILAEKETRQSTFNSWFFTVIIPVLLFIGFWIFIMRRMGGGAGGGGGQIFNIGKSKATLFDKESQVNVTFNDVAGLEEAKQEVMEIVDFLKKPKKIHQSGR